MKKYLLLLTSLQPHLMDIIIIIIMKYTVRKGPDDHYHLAYSSNLCAGHARKKLSCFFFTLNTNYFKFPMNSSTAVL